MPSATAERMIHELEADLTAAREALADAERELEAADAEVEAARERQGLGIAVRGATIKAQVARSRKQETVLVARGRLTGLTKQLAAQRDQEAAERARAASATLQAFRAEADALDSRVADLVLASRTGFDELDAAYRDLHVRSGGRLAGRTVGPANMARIWNPLMGALSELGRYYDKPTPRSATTSANKGA